MKVSRAASVPSVTVETAVTVRFHSWSKAPPFLPNSGGPHVPVLTTPEFCFSNMPAHNLSSSPIQKQYREFELFKTYSSRLAMDLVPDFLPLVFVNTSICVFRRFDINKVGIFIQSISELLRTRFHNDSFASKPAFRSSAYSEPRRKCTRLIAVRIWLRFSWLTCAALARKPPFETWDQSNSQANIKNMIC